MINVIEIYWKTAAIANYLYKFWNTKSLEEVKKKFLKQNEVDFTRNGIRYEVEPLWKRKYFDISDNYTLA